MRARKKCNTMNKDRRRLPGIKNGSIEEGCEKRKTISFDATKLQNYASHFLIFPIIFFVVKYIFTFLKSENKDCQDCRDCRSNTRRLHFAAMQEPTHRIPSFFC